MNILKKMYNIAKLKYTQYFIFSVAMLAMILLSLWKAGYGFGGYDETFYLTIPHRILQGDALFKDEWHVTQTSSVILLPFVWLFETITKSTDGIVWTMRIIYIIFHTVIAVFIYIRLRNYNYTSIIISVFYFIFIPFGTTAIDYNTVPVDMLSFIGVLLATSNTESKIPFIISGFAFSLVVLCSPYMTFAYILLIAVVLLNYVCKKFGITKISNMLNSTGLFSIKPFLYFSISIGISAVCFLLFVFSRISVGELLENIPYILSDNDHPPMRVIDRIRLLFSQIMLFNEYMYLVLISFTVLLIIMLLDRKRYKHKIVYISLSTIIAIFTEYLYIKDVLWWTFNSVASPVFFIGTVSYILCRKKPKKVFVTVFIPGLLYAVATGFSSNTYVQAISSSLSVTNIASFIFTAVFFKELFEEKSSVTYNIFKVISLLAFIVYTTFQGGMELYVKAYYCFGETSSISIKNYIDKGIGKGIYTGEVWYNEYTSLYEDIETNCKEYKGKKVDFITPVSYCYLMAYESYNNSLSAWGWTDYRSDYDRLKCYFSVNPDKIPDYIYVQKLPYLQEHMYIIDDIQKHNYKLTEENEVSYKFEKIN